MARVLTEEPAPAQRRSGRASRRTSKRRCSPPWRSCRRTALRARRQFAEALGDAAYAGSSGSRTRLVPPYAGAARGARSRQWALLVAIALAAAVSGLASGWALWHQRSPAFPPTVLRYTIALPDSAAVTDAVDAPISYAPDGSVFAYSSRVGLMLRYADRLEPVPVVGGRRGMGPFFSPDGRWLGFLDARQAGQGTARRRRSRHDL